jgi:phosphate transport system substrate-binding protein
MRISCTRRWGVVAAAALFALGLESKATDKIVLDGSTGVMPLASAIAKAFQGKHPETAFEFGKGLGTKARMRALAEGKIDVALASHGLRVDELTKQGMTVHEIARIAVVFAVNESVPIAGLSGRQICDIYLGKITNWNALGGPDLEIAARTRPDSEVDTEVMRAGVSCLRNLKMPEHVKVMPKSGDMAKELARVRGAIGMTSMTVVQQSGGRIKAVPLEGIAPTAENVKRSTYTLVRNSFFVTRGSPSPGVTRFIEFTFSSPGAEVIAANGAVPVK